jgi:hypothetical protein
MPITGDPAKRGPGAAFFHCGMGTIACWVFGSAQTIFQATAIMIRDNARQSVVD